MTDITDGAVVVAEAPSLTQLDVRTTDPGSLGLPMVPNTWTRPDDGSEALWLGPDEWLLIGPTATTRAESVVDVSANRAVLDLTGPGVREFLSKGCSLDLHPDHWADGACAQTILAKAPAILQQRETATRVFVRPSFADYLVEWFIAAARG
ncbi:MAG: sarcosine oxidase, subunit gamma [Actinomycetota bacterium]|jgi:sarcosine oxidase subunit gamma|nr:sarcosine oxidase, subunit gamma [Actinomycetota bacterium]